MTIASTARKAGPLLGTGTQTVFPFTFKVFAEGDIRVVTAGADGVEIVRVLGSDYSVSLNANQDTSPGGTVTYPISGAPLASGSVLSVIGDLDYDQPLDLPSGGNFSPLALENQLDRATIQIQQLREEMDRTAKLPPTSSESVEELVDDLQRIADSADNLDTVANNIADINTVATGIADVNTVASNLADVTNFSDVYYGPSASDPTLRKDGSTLQSGDLYFYTGSKRLRVFDGVAWVDGPINAGTITRDTFSGTGAQTAFTLSVDPVSENNAQVFIGGAYRQKSEYSVSGTTLTFSAAPVAGTNNIEVLSTTTLALGTTDAELVGFQQAGTGAVPTTVQSKLRETVSVFDFMTDAQIEDVKAGAASIDVTAAVQAAVTAANGKKPVRIPGFCLVSATIDCPTDTQLVGDSRDTCGFIRTPTHTGHTLQMGVATPGLHAGAVYVYNLWFRRLITFNGGNQYVAGTSTSVDNRLTGGQAHIFGEHIQRGTIEACTFDNMPYHLILAGAATTDVKTCDFGGSIWDPLTPALQEGIAEIWLKVGYDGFCPTEITTSGNRLIGGFGSAPRNVTVGASVVNFSENIGPKFGVLVEGMEGWASSDDYIGGQSEHCILFNATSGNICSNGKISNAFLDGAGIDCVHFSHGNAGGATTMVAISNTIMNCETVGRHGIGSDSLFNAPVAYNVTLSNVTIMATLYAGIVDFGIIGLQVSGGSISGYNCRGGNTGVPEGASAIYADGTYADKLSATNVRVGGAVNNLADSNNCQWGVYCGGTFAHEPFASGIVDMGLGLAGGALVVGTQNTLKTPTLLNGWVAVDGHGAPTYFRDGDGVVHLAGAIQTGTIGLSAFVLPAKYRPTGTHDFAVCGNDIFAAVRITGSGDVTPVVGTAARISLNGISFPATA